ncbi:hypothetical protein [Roseovarius sp. MMSF_3281]|uniref:hypothetical protein n=1 Tax=Roseovarius sp. MMSF_3281 TaxID=3046694 RepID=UPI00273E0ADA|nr:hypothetical protein [Roseovarius sp. MMSF_3281]
MLDFLSGLIYGLPNWVPVLTSIVATTISIAAYRNSLPPTKPMVFAEIMSHGDLGAWVRLTIRNKTRHTVRALSASDPSGSQRLAHSPQENGETPHPPKPSSPDDRCNSVSLGFDIPPDSEATAVIAVFRDPIDSDIFTISCSIRLMRAASKTITIPAPVEIPDKNSDIATR